MLTGKKITDPTSGMRMVNKKLLEKFTDEYPKDYPEPESVVTILSEKYSKNEKIKVDKNVDKITDFDNSCHYFGNVIYC